MPGANRHTPLAVVIRKARLALSSLFDIVVLFALLGVASRCELAWEWVALYIGTLILLCVYVINAVVHETCSPEQHDTSLLATGKVLTFSLLVLSIPASVLVVTGALLMQ
jgi:hypothetical protein